MVLILKEIVSFEIIETPSVLYSFSTDIAMSTHLGSMGCESHLENLPHPAALHSVDPHEKALVIGWR